ncbi:glutathione peroxidase [bacterium]|nr:MAG: glutathione peroxidase [bacterium]
MKILSILTIGFISMILSVNSIYDFKVKTIDGEEKVLNEYKGKVLLIVNTASKCGYTPQYEGLQAIYEEYKEQGFEILGFPANNFLWQEPGSDEEIKEFCSVNYNVSFQMFSKVSVKGDDQAPLFTYLTEVENPDFTGSIKWNFEKFLISKDGKLLHRFRSGVKPESDEMKNAIKAALEAS